MYRPKPIDTSFVKLPRELDSLVELLSRNTHENWALQRIRDNWTYGEQRDDTEKKHPCLVPYEQLPESEKEYDRKISEEVLKTILAMGYRISQ